MGGIFYGNLSVIFFDDTFNNGKTQSVSVFFCLGSIFFSKDIVYKFTYESVIFCKKILSFVSCIHDTENYLYEEKRSKMRYGYFDNEKREYVITRPDTPAPWVNYLGSPEYGAIISNNAGGYSFEKSGANGRILSLTSTVMIHRDVISI